jgi:ABC-type nickel/cobalt efflux system permease component RcnA
MVRVDLGGGRIAGQGGTPMAHGPVLAVSRGAFRVTQEDETLVAPVPDEPALAGRQSGVLEGGVVKVQTARAASKQHHQTKDTHQKQHKTKKSRRGQNKMGNVENKNKKGPISQSITM